MLDLIDQATQRRDGNPTGNNQYSGTVDIINSSTPRPTGTSKQSSLRRLRKDRPDLHQRVINKEVSAHAAMIEAGYQSTQ